TKGDALEYFLAGGSLDELRNVFDTGWAGSLPGSPAVLTTGADGRFKLAGVGRDRFVLFRLEGPGIGSAGGAVAAGAGEKVGRLCGASFDHLAAASRPVRGVVRDKATGKPLAGASVAINWYGDNRWAKSVTDDQGRYELLGLAKSPRYPLAV